MFRVERCSRSGGGCAVSDLVSSRSLVWVMSGRPPLLRGRHPCLLHPRMPRDGCEPTAQSFRGTARPPVSSARRCARRRSCAQLVHPGAGAGAASRSWLQCHRRPATRRQPRARHGCRRPPSALTSTSGRCALSRRSSGRRRRATQPPAARRRAPAAPRGKARLSPPPPGRPPRLACVRDRNRRPTASCHRGKSPGLPRPSSRRCAWGAQAPWASALSGEPR